MTWVRAAFAMGGTLDLSGGSILVMVGGVESRTKKNPTQAATDVMTSAIKSAVAITGTLHPSGRIEVGGGSTGTASNTICSAVSVSWVMMTGFSSAGSTPTDERIRV